MWTYGKIRVLKCIIWSQSAAFSWVKYTYMGNAVSLFIIDTRTAVE